MFLRNIVSSVTRRERALTMSCTIIVCVIVVQRKRKLEQEGNATPACTHTMV